MCGRSSLTKTEKELEQRFNATFYSEDLERYNPIPNFNVAPTHYMPVITNEDPSHISIHKWGLIPYWAKDSKIGVMMINARIETILEKPTYKSTLKSKRCLVPMDGFYEWKKNGKEKQPYRIQTKSQEIYSCAGLWETWKDENDSGNVIYSFTIITIPSNEFMSQIHDRMPAILTQDQEQLWLTENFLPEDLPNFLIPYPSDDMKMYPVSQKVNSVRENNASLIAPVGIQGSLF
jgi:putative SOS response-associated peptidase YedK